MWVTDCIRDSHHCVGQGASEASSLTYYLPHSKFDVGRSTCPQCLETRVSPDWTIWYIPMFKPTQHTTHGRRVFDVHYFLIKPAPAKWGGGIQRVYFFRIPGFAGQARWAKGRVVASPLEQISIRCLGKNVNNHLYDLNPKSEARSTKQFLMTKLSMTKTKNITTLEVVF